MIIQETKNTKVNILLNTLNEFDINSEIVDNEKADILIDGIIWEVKTSKQGEKHPTHSLQGSTHSSSKCNNYILIRYGVNWNRIFKYKTKPNYFINSLHFSVISSETLTRLGPQTPLATI